MMDFLWNALLVLGGIALIASVILYVCSKKFAVKEDPRWAVVNEALPGANCGGCGFPGCSGMADALVKGADAGSIDGLNCPVGGPDVMSRVADLLGMAIANSEPKVAVVRCNGTCELRARIAEYDGLRTCTAMNATGSGETGCGYGCLGCGDCVDACQFDAIHLNKKTGLPEVDEEKCTSCGACVKACPRHIIELRKRGPKNRRVYVRCVNKDKGAAAMKACKAACIGCGKCQKECKFEAITIESNLCYIDSDKCRLCRKCEAACPTGAIVAVNFPPKKDKPTTDNSAPKAEAKVEPQTQVKTENVEAKTEVKTSTAETTLKKGKEEQA